MVKAHFIYVREHTREIAESKLGEEFNKFMETHRCKIFHVFEPVRTNEIYGDSSYNKYITMLTFLYEI